MSDVAEDNGALAVVDDRTIGRRLRSIRHARRKSLRVVAELAGISESHLSRLENGERALDRLSLIVALAEALQVAPSELVALPVPSPFDGGTDAAMDALRLTMMAVSYGHAVGEAMPVEAIRERVDALIMAQCRCEHEQVGAALPALVRDVHASIAAGRDVAELLDLAVLLHTQGTVAWLRTVGAPLDLASQAAMMAARAAQERDNATALGLATASTARVMIMMGAFDLAQHELDSVTIPTTTPEEMQLAGFRALRQSVVAAADSRPGEVAAPLEYASELAERTGEGNAYYLAFGPLNIGLYRIAGELEAGNDQRAVNIAESLNPDEADESRQAYYWVDYARALSRLRGRREEAVRALSTAERLAPTQVHRSPFTRDTIAELVARSKRDAVGRELRGMAYRAGLPV